MTNLSERVMELSGPDREVDWQIAESLGWTCRQVGQVMAYYAPNDAIMKAGPPKWTASIDAAMMLLPEGWMWSIGSDGPEEGPWACLTAIKDLCEDISCCAATPALALCAAALLAREAGKLSEQQIADGWKPHDGGECPVGFGVYLSIMFRDGEILVGQHARTWADKDPDLCNFHWDARHHGAGDIIAYKEQSHDD